MSYSSNSNYYYSGSGSGSSRQRSRLIYDSSDDESSSIESANYYSKHSNDSVASSSKATSYSNASIYSNTQKTPGELIASDKLWPADKDHLNVYFMNGSAAEQSLVKYLVREHYNTLPIRIQFKFLSQGELYRSDIRLEFAWESWSCIGTDAQYHPNQTTMYVNMHPARNTEEGIRAKIQADILHEFGHALGMMHAHKHPDCKVNLNYEKVARTYGWPVEKVRKNWDKDTSSVLGKSWDLPYDPQSIMHYPVWKGDTHSCITEIAENIVLSDGDKRMLRRRYPKGREGRETTRHEVSMKLVSIPETKPEWREEKETNTRTKTRREVSKKLVSIPETKPKRLEEKKSKQSKYTQEPSTCGPVYVTGSGSSTVQGGNVVVTGSGSVMVNGGGHVTLSGSGKVVVYGDSTVKLTGSGSVYVHGSGTAVVYGSGRVRFSGRGTGTTLGSGSISSYA